VAEVEEVYQRYFKDVFLFVYSLCKDQHVAEDITSEAFMKALKSMDQFKGESDIRVWLCQIAKNTYFSHLRKKKRLVYQELQGEVPQEESFEKKILSSETAMKVHEILHSLPEPYKEVFTLRVFAELSFKQIGQIFGKSENWACVTYHRARKKIQGRMEGDHENYL